ncbi:hypothetical protein C8R47DRAFT_1229840 [Mycena vitilis]|nr:hypothetical protein C8R47DRAFT_1229840 [Mycena vitilis]
MYAAHLAEQDARTLMTNFGLPFAHVRFLLLASPTIIAGAAIPWLLFPESRTDITTLDIYTGAGCGHLVLKYLGRVSADYALDTGANVEGQCWTKSVLRLGSRQLRVFESSTTVLSALLITSATSAGMGYMDGSAIRHGYPRLMDNKRAITTPRQLPLATTLKEQRETWAILHEIVDQGFSIEFQLEDGHKCGADTSCPATLRHTGDDGWMSVRLPDVHYGSKCANKGCTWSLFGCGCNAGILNGGELSATVDEEG